MVLLPLASPRFPVRDAFEVLDQAEHPAFAFVAQVFGEQYTNALDLVMNLSHNHEHVTVVIYLECGPCRPPRRPSGYFNLISNTLDIDQFNQRIELQDSSILNDLRVALLPIWGTLPALPGVHYIIHPGLEDNFTDRAYLVVAGIIKEMYSGRSDWSLGSNANSGIRRPLTVHEVHGYDLSKLSLLNAGDILSGDGDLLCLPGESCGRSNVEDIKKMLCLAKKKKVTMLLWRPETQGLPLQKAPKPLPEKDRQYVIPAKDYLIDLLEN